MKGPGAEENVPSKFSNDVFSPVLNNSPYGNSHGLRAAWEAHPERFVRGVPQPPAIAGDPY
jgi:hypothetical protein